MTKLAQLIADLCPKGISFKTLAELGKFFGGLTGKSKDDFNNGNAKFITYKNVYSNPALQINVEDTVKIENGEKQHTLQYADIIFTGSSETPDECGFSSVVTIPTKEKLYLNSFCFFFRFNNPEIMLPDFAKHLFRSNNLRYQIGKTASGVTRFNVSKKLMGKVLIPIPPLPVQEEIVRILDTFTELIDKLKAELTARKKQYEYYCKQIIETAVDVEMVKIRDLGAWSGGMTPSMKNKEYWEKGTIPWISSKDMKTSILIDTQDHITELAIEKTTAKILPKNIVAIVARSGILKHTLPVAFVPFKATVNQDIKALIVKDGVIPKYAYFVILTYAEDILRKTKKAGGTVDSLDVQAFMDYQVPLASLSKQQQIVDILDHFDTLCHDLSSGLPAEIAARQKQYEYYRDKLLTFEELPGQ